MSPTTQMAARLVAGAVNVTVVVESENYTRDNATRLFREAGASEATAKYLSGCLSLGIMLALETASPVVALAVERQ